MAGEFRSITGNARQGGSRLNVGAPHLPAAVLIGEAFNVVRSRDLLV
jgi:hypothetical protein